MGKVRSGLVLGLTALCLCLAALLPRFTGWVQDRRAVGQVRYGRSAQVRLEIREDLPTIGALAVIARVESAIEVPEALTELGPEKALQTGQEALEPYMDCGLIPEFPMECYECRPILFQTEGGGSLTGIIWILVFADEQDASNYVQLDLDDRTGKVLRISFSRDGGGYEDREKLLELFARTYFTGLGMEGYSDAATGELEGQYIGDDVSGIRYRFRDETYGSVAVDLFVNRYGLYMELGQ